jgi:ribulose-phosphate 3-epimerase
MTIGPEIVKSLRKITKIPVDVHLMVDNPDWFIREFSNAGIDMISIHPESVCHLQRSLQRIRECGSKAGVALNPATPFKMLEYVLKDLDYLLVMTVNPGFAGQQFLPTMIPKIEESKRTFDELGLEIDIEVDGGINNVTVPLTVKAGANILIAGSAIFEHKNLRRAINELRRAAEI